MNSPPALIVPLGGAEPVRAVVAPDEPLGLHDDERAPAGSIASEHRAESQTRSRRRMARAHGRKSVVIGVAGVVVIVVVAVVLLSALGGATGPSPRFQALMAEDPATGQFLLVGGRANGTDPDTLSDMWTWSGHEWAELSEQAPDNSTLFASMAYDSETRQLLLVQVDPASRTWVWNGHSWHAGSGLTTAELLPALGYDSATEQFIAVSAAEPGALTSIWDGHRWAVQQRAGNLPPVGGLMAYDQKTTQLLFVGAQPGSPTLTWVWTGRLWKRLRPSQELPVNLGSRTMSYDGATGQVVLFQTLGSELTGYSNQTWTWDGRTWIEQHPATSPPPRSWPSLAYDASTRQLLLFGGSSANTNVTYNDTWDWTGSTWVKVA